LHKAFGTIMNNGLKRRADGAVPAAIPGNDLERVAQLRQLCVLDTGKDDRFDRITKLASEILNVPIVLVSLVDESREWFKSTVGTDIVQIDREHGFCAHAILVKDDAPFTIVDSLADARFATHPFVVGGPKLRFYCGAPLLSASGHKIGMLCVHDFRPRPDFDNIDKQRLKQFAQIIMDEINFHRGEMDRKLLIGELSHRVKNIYATISSLARTSVKKDQSAVEYVEALTDRLSAMAAAHEKLVENAWQGANCGDIVRIVLSAHQDYEEHRFVVDIPELQVSPESSQTLALCIHELLTNSIKHGALKSLDGQVFVNASRILELEGQRDIFVWREFGGSATAAPTQRGFGHKMMTSSILAGGGAIDFDWKAEGLICTFELVTKY
jgi:two-component sensor histidine kinase